MALPRHRRQARGRPSSPGGGLCVRVFLPGHHLRPNIRSGRVRGLCLCPICLALIMLSFAFALFFSFALSCLPDVVSIASARFDDCR